LQQVNDKLSKSLSEKHSLDEAFNTCQSNLQNTLLQLKTTREELDSL